MASIRERACGSVFASTVIKSLTTTNGVAMQPKDPNDNQVATFNAYTQSIIDVCRSDITGFSDQQNFVVPYAGDSTQKPNPDPHPSNTGETEPGPAGGVLRSAQLREAMTRAMTIGDVRMMAQLFSETCPGDWSRGWGVGLNTMLKDAVRHGIEPENRRIRRHIDVAEFTRYRWQLAEMAGSFIQEYMLRKPDDEICLLWDDLNWLPPAQRTIPGFGDRFSRAYGHLVHEGFYPVPMRYQGPYFDRFNRYMAAAVALTALSQEENDWYLDSLVCRMDMYKEFYKKICVEDKGVLQKKREWHEAIGFSSVTE